MKWTAQNKEYNRILDMSLFTQCKQVFEVHE